MNSEELRSLERFVDKEINRIMSETTHAPKKIQMPSYLYNPFFSMFAHNPFTVTTHIYYRGCIIEESKLLNDNEIAFDGVIKIFDSKSVENHWCGGNLSRYVGFTHIYDFCRICDKKFNVDIFKK